MGARDHWNLRIQNFLSEKFSVARFLRSLKGLEDLEVRKIEAEGVVGLAEERRRQSE